MKIHLPFLLAFCLCSALLFGQNQNVCLSNLPIPLGDNCITSCVVCSSTEVFGNNFSQLTNPGLPLLFCDPGAFQLNNPGFFTYVATAPEVMFSLESFNCQQNQGLQFALYDGCFTNPIPLGCIEDEHIQPFVTISNLIPGKTYTILIDGFNNDMCEFILFIEPQNGGTPLAPMPDAVSPQDISGPTTVCPNQIVSYTLPPIEAASFVNLLPGAVSISQDPNNWFPTNQLQVSPNQPTTFWAIVPPGVHTIGIQTGNDCVLNPTLSPLVIQTLSQIVVSLPVDSLSEDDLPYVSPLTGEVFTMPGNYITQNSFTSASGCDSIVNQNIVIIPNGVGGIVFIDNNVNGVYDLGDELFSNAIITASNGSMASSNSDGYYSFANLVAGDNLSITPPAGFATVPATQLVSGNGLYNFALQAIGPGFDLSIDLTNIQVFRQGFQSELQVTVSNLLASSTANTQVKVVLPHFLDYISANPAPSTIQGDTLCWTLGTLQGLTTQTISIQTKTLLGTPNSTPINVYSWVEPISNDANPSNNYSLLATQVVGSYDPNDKQVQPQHITPELLQEGTPLEYTIRFQNTGNYPATFVRVIDTLGFAIQAASFSFISSSHPCSWKLKSEGIVDFFFENIHLPDSTSDEPGSHGFVKFRVLPESDLDYGQQVLNFCDIYFDFNDPIRTNTAGTIVVPFLPEDGAPPADNALRVRPNPAAHLQQFGWLTPAEPDSRLIYFDMLGLSRLETAVPEGSQQALVDVSQLDEGAYFVLYISGGQTRNTLVLIHRSGLPFGQN
jgi:uncharacterized repeat protein (TIGR01451 family)